ncbi:MAG TPA: ASCH domain-containing protein [Actinomycetota bacterium]|jgi:hypothetical protein|nr:ASCH domain-containing protein [Actinomycetota bacterium]
MKPLPFRDDMLEAIRAGRKSCTARTKRFGKPGDLLDTQGAGTVRLVSVEKLPLAVVRDEHWAQEGMSSPEDFVRVWAEIHSHKGFVPDQMVWLHTFEPA